MKTLFTIISRLRWLLILGVVLTGCSFAVAETPQQPQTVQETVVQTVVVVVTATPPANQPTPTPGPTAAQLPTATPPLQAKPSPTPLQLLNIPIEGGDSDHMFFARLVFPDYRPAATTSLVFQVYAHSPMNSTKDGEGIVSVEFWIYDQNDDEVYNHVENTAAYCAFGGGEPDCTVWDFESNHFQWPSGIKIKSGLYTLKVVATSRDNVDMFGQSYFQVQVP